MKQYIWIPMLAIIAILAGYIVASPTKLEDSERRDRGYAGIYLQAETYGNSRNIALTMNDDTGELNCTSYDGVVEVIGNYTYRHAGYQVHTGRGIDYNGNPLSELVHTAPEGAVIIACEGWGFWNTTHRKTEYLKMD